MHRTTSNQTRLVLNGVDDDETPASSSKTSNTTTTKYAADVKRKAETTTTKTSRTYSTSSDSKPGYRLILPPEEMETNDTTTTIINSLVNPATVPIRTSSRSSSLVNGDKPGVSSSTTSPGKTPKKHRSMASVPEEGKDKDRKSRRSGEGSDGREGGRWSEVDERQWLAQGRGNRNTISGPPPSSSFSPRATMAESSSSKHLSDPLRTGVGLDLVSGLSLGWSSEKENILKGPFNYLESHPGKDVRTQLITGFNSWLQVPSSSLRIITGVVTMLHTASLLIDDVEDSSLLRRGVPVAHSIFGTAQTINSANYVYFCALQELLKLNNPEAVRIYTDELLNLHRGQGMDLFWRDTLTCPSEDDYLEMVGNKTGGLFRLAIKLMCAESPSHNFTSDGSPIASGSAGGQPDYIPLVNTIGLLFQILDDYRNLSDTTYTQNKGLCEDLTEGKFSFPIIHSIRSDPSNLVLINILKQKTKDEDVKRFAVSYMEGTGSFAYTRRVIRGLQRKAGGLLEEVDQGRGRGEGIREVLEKLGVSSSGGSGREGRISQG